MTTKENTFKITGRIIDRFTRSGAGLPVEAWDKDLLVQNIGGSAIADEQGFFQIEFDQESFRELCLERRRSLFFRVFQDGQLVQDTRALVVWNEERANHEIVIEGDFKPSAPQPIEGREVKGNVLLADGSPANGLVITALVRSLREERALGKTETDLQGFYQIDYSTAKRATADGTALVVKAFAHDGSTLATSPPLFNAPPVAVVDLSIPAEALAPPSLFEKIHSALAPLLKDMEIQDLSEDDEHQDVSFLSAQTGFATADLARFILAHRLTDDRLRPEFWFAMLGRSTFLFTEDTSLNEMLTTFRDSLSTLDATTVRKSIAAAISGLEISRSFSDRIGEWVAAFLTFAARESVSGGSAPTFLKLALDQAGIDDPGQQEKLALLFNQYRGLTPEVLTALQNDCSFRPEDVANLHASYQLADITQTDFSVVKAIKEEFRISRPEEIRTLARKTEGEWIALITTKLAGGEISLPVELSDAPGLGKPSEAETLGKTLERQFREAFPTTAFAGRLEHSLSSGGPRGLKHGDVLSRLLEQHEEFDLLHTRVDDFLKNNPRSEYEVLGFREEVMAVQRVFSLAATFAATDALLADGLHSAQQIYRLGESRFVQNYGSVVGFDPCGVTGVWNRAADTHAAALTIIADLKSLDPNALPQVLQSGNQALSSFPNWENLFQTGDLCDCEACRSVLGPAAYFADLLMFLKDRQAANGTVKDLLFSRRPDLGYLELNCENALTVLPYIDVVNEVLEAAIATDENDVEVTGLTTIPDTSAATKTVVATALQVAGLSFGADFSLSQVNPLDPNRWVVHGDRRTCLLKKKTTANFFAEVLRNTKAKADELRAYPDYVNPVAYDKLRQAKYPRALPFDLFGEEVRAAMQKTNLQRWDLMQTFRGVATRYDTSDSDIAAEYFGISIDSASLRFSGAMTAAQRTILLNDPALAAVTGIPSYQEAIDELFGRARQCPVRGLPTGFTFPAVITGAPNHIPIRYEPFTFDEKTLILIADATFAGQQAVWGETGTDWLDVTGNVASSLCIVQNFLQKTGLEYNELLALLDLEFINPAGDIAVHHLDTSCDTAKKVVAVLDEAKLDRIHRFLRLWRKLKGWKLWEVDLVIRHPAIGHGDLNDAFLVNLFYFSQLKNRLGKNATVEQVCALFGNLNIQTHFTRLHEPREDALYQRLFLNRGLTNPLDPAFELDPVTNDLPPGQTIAAHQPVLVAALGLSEADLVIIEGLKISDGSPLTPDLNLTNLSFVWRHAWLSKLLKFKADEWRLMRKIAQQDIDEFPVPQVAWDFVTQVDQIRSAGFTLDELNWVLAVDRSAKAAVKETDAARFLSALRNELQKIHTENDPTQYGFLTAVPPTDEGQLRALLTTLLQKLNRDDAAVSLFLAVLRGSVQLESKVKALPAGFAFPASITAAPNHIPIHYDEPNLMFRFAGVMTDAQWQVLRDDPSPALSALQGSAHLAAAAQGIPAGFVFPVVIADAIPIQYDEPNALLRFNGLMTDAQRAILRTDPSLAAVTGIPGYLTAIEDLYEQSIIILASYQAAIDDLYQQSLTATTNYAVTEIEVSLPGVTLPVDRPSLPIRYDLTNEKLSFTGVMTDAERLDLIAAPNPAPAIDELFQRTRLAIKFYEPVFSTALDALPPAVDFQAQLAAELAAKITYDAEQRLLKFTGIMSASEQLALDALVPGNLMLSPPSGLLPSEIAYHIAISILFSQPLDIVLPDDRIWLTDGDLDASVPANDTLAKRLANATTRALNYLAKTLAGAAVIRQSSAQLKLTEAMTRRLLTEYEVLPSSPLPFRTVFDYLTQDFAVTTGAINYATHETAFQGWFWASRVATLWKKWKITLAESERLTAITANSFLLDLLTLPLDSGSPPASLYFFLKTCRLLRLRDSFPETETTLLEVLEKLNGAIPSPIADITDLANSDFPADVEKVNDAWPQAFVKTLVESLDVINPGFYLFAETWERLRRAFYYLEILNSDPVTVQTFATARMSDVDAKTLKELLRSKFGSETWLSLSTEIQDVLRERKRDALAAFLLTRPPAVTPSGKWENTNDLYAYYLLDVEMSSCQLTSRLVQASGSVQLFVQRCFMGLEPEVEVKADGADGDSAWRWWKWMRKFQLWVANRKVFLWPENWIEPELKPDRSQFFKDLENELMQNEVNQENVETAFANYLEKLDGVAQLEIAGFYQEDDGDNAIVHVFGRTKGAEPHIYYYRRFDYRQWSPWEKIDLDIQGDYLIPAVINRELFLFWPVFTEAGNEAGNESVSTPSANQNNVPLQKTKKNLRLQMAVSNYRKEKGKWSPKQVSTDAALSNVYEVELVRKHYQFYAIDRSDLDGRFGIVFSGFSLDGQGRLQAGLFGAFEIAGCKGVPELASFPRSFAPATRPEAAAAGLYTSFQRWLELGPVPARGDGENDFSLVSYGLHPNGPAQVLIQTPWLFKMTTGWHLSYFDKLMLDGVNSFHGFRHEVVYTPLGSWLPFFYDDRKRTFFVLPTTLQNREGARTYYPELKKNFRCQQGAYEAEVQKWISRLQLGPAERTQLEQFLHLQFPEEPNPPYTEAQIKALLKRYYMRFFNWYLGTQAFELFQYRQHQFKNFYHPFVCDFAKLVYNPLKGIPALMSRETQLQDSGFSFRQHYVPTPAVVNSPIKKAYPNELVDFSPDGSYSSYNWELFFHAPLLVGNALSRNQRFEEARDWYHFIFNPLGVESGAPGGSAMSKFWITKPFFETTDPQYVQQRIDNILGMLAGGASSGLESQVVDWRTYPFAPHRIANYRTVAYQKTVVMKYLDNLISWGDYLFRQDSMESINEATQLYILAAELLGEPPKNVPPQAKPPLESFNELENQFDEFSNALVEVENLVPPLPGTGGSGNAAPLPTLYFCIPHNEKMLGYWKTVADRLYKIRHCMNIEGVVRQLALFEPPIDPAALVKAVAGGVDISSALADLNAPLPIYRFNVFLQKANELCAEVKALGGALLSALEKKDAEAFALLRQGQEMQLLAAVRAVREQQIDEAKENAEGIRRSRKITEERRNFYRDVQKVSNWEKASMVAHGLAIVSEVVSTVMNATAGTAHLVPDFNLGASGFGGTPHVVTSYGGKNIAESAFNWAAFFSGLGGILHSGANLMSTQASNERRWEDWKLQERLAERELLQLDKQISAAELRVAIAEKELQNHQLQIDNAKAVDDFMRSKYTNEELYQWQVGQISGVYFQSYKLAYDLAKRAERCFRFELGLQDSSYIKFGYWDSLKKGLLSGEKLQYDLRRLETAYLDQNRREYELTKHISLALLDPLALIKLRETGRCFFQFPEEIFDLDYPGHYFRRIKSVSLTLPCVTGPYTTISCTLRLLNSNIRINTDNPDSYRHNSEGDLPADDSRFIENNIPVKAIAASSAQNDSGLFELNFRDDRYLPFEGAGVISGWAVELFTDLPSNNPDKANPDFGSPLRQFDYETISDAIVHVRYTAREDAGPFKNSAVSNLRDYFRETVATPSQRMLNLRQEFPSQWRRFLTPTNPNGPNIFEFEMSPSLFQIKDMDKTLKINSIWLLARCTADGVYSAVLTLPAKTINFSLAKVNQFGGLHFSQQALDDVEVVPSDPPALWQLQMTRPLGANLQDKEVEDLIMVLGYQLDLQLPVP